MGFFTSSKDKTFGTVGKGKTRLSAWSRKDGTFKFKLGSGKSKGKRHKSKTRLEDKLFPFKPW